MVNSHNKIKYMKIIKRLLFLIFVLLLHSCNEDTLTPFKLSNTSDYSNDVAIEWVNLERDLVKGTAGFTPPVAARSYGYAGLALYESCVPGISKNRSYAGLINGYTGQGIPKIETGKDYNWELSVNAAMAYMLRNLFKTTSSANLALIDQLEQKYLTKNSSVDSLIKNRSVNFGRAVGTAIYDYSKTDNQEAAYANNFPDYTLPNIPGVWEPTSPNNPKPLQPYWGSVRPFNSQNVADAFVQTYTPTPFSTDPKSVFYNEASQVYVVGLNLTAEQTTIAKFWSDDPGLTSTPPGHSMSIAGIVLKQEGSDLAKAAEVYSKVGMAVHDAFVSCWKCKYVYNLLRPVTYIKKYIDPNFSTLLSTPPFPEHTSGHSVQTAASMAVLENYFGYHYTVVDDTHATRSDINGSPRTFASFADLAREAAISRLYGGIHYAPAIDKGILQGHVIGRNIALINLSK